MTIQIGDVLPDVPVQIMGQAGPETVQSRTLLGQGRVLLFAVPGAFTPGCSKSHLPGYVNKAAELTAKGIDRIVCMSVNDAFVMHAWGLAQQADAITMLADGNADLATALGLSLDARQFGMGTRSQRFALIAEEGVVRHLAVEPAGGITVSAADAMLAQL